MSKVKYSRMLPSFSWGIFGHVKCLPQSRASENFVWIISAVIHVLFLMMKARMLAIVINRSIRSLVFEKTLLWSLNQTNSSH